MSSPRFGWLLSPVMSWNNFLEPCKGGILGIPIWWQSTCWVQLFWPVVQLPIYLWKLLGPEANIEFKPWSMVLRLQGFIPKTSNEGRWQNLPSNCHQDFPLPPNWGVDAGHLPERYHACDILGHCQRHDSQFDRWLAGPQCFGASRNKRWWPLTKLFTGDAPSLSKGEDSYLKLSNVPFMLWTIPQPYGWPVLVLCRCHAAAARIAVRKIILTQRNTGLDKKSTEFPELGRAWKAAHIKVLVWYMAVKAIEYADSTGETRWYDRYLCWVWVLTCIILDFI